MRLKDFKDYIEAFPEGTIFNFGISVPFSWRGSYTEVAFELLQSEMSREGVLTRIELAYERTFNGYRGGDYQYNDYTRVNFEEDYSCYSDGQYVAEWIAKIEQSDIYQSQEERLIKLAFKLKD